MADLTNIFGGAYKAKLSEPETLKEHALAYASIGWRIFPAHNIENGKCSCGDSKCKSPGKHPRFNGWQDAATSDTKQITQWWDVWPNANIAMATGLQSGVWALDIDVKDNGDYSLEKLVSENSELPETPTQETGSGGNHYFFSYDKRMSNRVSVVAGIDVRADGGLVILSPSSNANGKYEFIDCTEPYGDDAVSPAQAPEWLIEALKPKSQDIKHSTVDSEFVDLVEVASALDYLDSYNRDAWLLVGMGLHTVGTEDAFDTWCDWSCKCEEKYDHKDQQKTWKSFSVNRDIKAGIGSIYYEAEKLGWVRPEFNWGKVDCSGLLSKISGESTEKANKIENNAPNYTAERETQETNSDTAVNNEKPLEVSIQAEDNAPEWVKSGNAKRGAGIIDEIADFANATAAKPQPELSVHSAIAICSLVLGRKYITDNNNMASLYLLSVAKSGSGKEHGKTVIERILKAADMEQYIGGSKYTSEGAVFSSLIEKPKHITVIDELGRYLEAARSKNDSHKREVITAMMEAIGRLTDTMRPATYSTMTLTKEQRDDMPSRNIEYPAITMYSMTTPSTLYDALDVDSIKDGFLGRFLIKESTIGRQIGKPMKQIDVPESVLQWIKEVNTRGVGNLGSISSYDRQPNMVRLPFAKGCWEILDAFELEIFGKQDDLESLGIESILTRAKEMSMRLALIVSLAKNSFATSVDVESVEWAIEYVKDCYYPAVEQAKKNIGVNAFEKQQEEFYNVIKSYGAKGITSSDMARISPFRKYKARERGEILNQLKDAELIDLMIVPNPSGRPKQVWKVI
ncbi:putative bifunctional DNA primase/polymerase [Pseudoalteromonas phage C7]|uniref:putative bifunctional DNA primase/polymerase n=1 Tax=Pseudoalteromonas phage C7 TaxID=2510494 RepID=UPI0010180C74|nr:putative bifunctional DNA primase/polymerase [Pseudoalteromonas phage C7]QAY18002.1 putative bifunctional DNA primase/polymerase [Pseudoalteromonas phage C7]